MLRSENWKKVLNENFQIGTVPTDLSISLDCIPHDLLKQSFILMV